MRRASVAITLLTALALSVVAACGGSSSNTTTGPTTTRCAVALRTDAPTVDAGGGAGVLSITVNRECTWEARSDVPWITVASAPSGQGAGTVTFQVAVNPQPQSRRGHLIVNGVQSEVVQTGAACQFSLEPTVGTAPATGGTIAVQVRGLTGCPWTATSQAPWARVVGGASGDGNGVVNLTVDANSGDPRTGTALIAGLPFTVAQAGAAAPPVGGCALSVAPTTLTFPAAGGTGTVAIGGNASCAWTATTALPWVTVGGPASGQGPGAVALVAAPNTSTTVRTGTVAIANTPVLVVQEAAAPPTPPVVSCTYGLTPQTTTVPAGGGSTVVSVATAPECPWTATTSAAWLVVAGGTSGTGPGAITVSASANPGTTLRSATVNAGGQAVTVTQPAPGSTPGPSTCTFAVAPTAVSAEATASLSSVTVTASADTCGWTASSPVPWITIGVSSGTGSGPLSFALTANPETAPRTATLTVAGQPVLVTQAGAAAPTPPCTFSVAPTAVDLAAAGGSGQVSVTTGTTCTWTAMSGAPWLAVSSGSSGTGSGQVSFQAAANPDAAPRTTTLTVAGQTVTVTQAAAAPQPCSYALSPPSAGVPATGGATGTRLETGASCTWTATAQVPWIQLTSPTTGSGPADIAVVVQANGETTSRTGTVLVAGQTFTVTQEAATPTPCAYALVPTSANVAAAGGTVTTRLETTASCTWTATTQAPWIQIAGATSGTGAADLALTVAVNPDTVARTGTVVIGGQTFTVVQEAAQPAPTCTFDVMPASQSVGAEGGAAAVTVTASATSCSWTATSNAPWIVVVSGAQGTGSGNVSLQVGENVSTEARTGTVSVAGQTVEIVQAGRAAQTVTLNGRMADTNGTCPTLAFKIMGTPVVTDANTTFEGAPCAVLRNGTMVTVDGVVQAGGTVLATRVRATP